MMRPKLIPLKMWAERRLGRPPSDRTLRRWALAGNIMPRPRKFGRGYVVPENAEFIDLTDPNYLEHVASALNESSSQ